jgi:hypothetical protein
VRRSAIIAGVLVTLAALASVLTQSAWRLTGTNSNAPVGYLYRLSPGQSACQSSEIPSGSGYAHVFAGTFAAPGPPLRVSATSAAGQTLFSVPAPGGYRNGWRWLRIPALRMDEVGATFCITDAGVTPLALAGNNFGSATIAGAPKPGAFTLEYFGAHKQTWLSELGAIARRMGHSGETLAAGWELWLVVLLGIASWFLALRLLLRQES